MQFNGPQIHLMVNHFPIVGFILLTPILALVAWRGDAKLRQLTLVATVVVSLFVLPAFWTGEPAEEGVEHIPGVSEKDIHEHEEAAETALTLSLVTGAIALAGLLASKKKPAYLPLAVKVSFLGAAVTSALMANVGHEGGKIRHPEITGATPSQDCADAKASEKNEDPSSDESDAESDEESDGDEE